MDASSSIARMHEIFSLQRKAYVQMPMPAFELRKQQLLTLKALLLEHTDNIAAAINADFSARSSDETMLVEILPCIQHINYTLKRLRSWMKPSRRSVGLHLQPARAKVVYQPLGVVGIIAPFNYPLILSIIPLITAIAAGNRAMLKMSELTPRTAELMRQMLSKGFTDDQIAVITGGIDVASAFSKIPFDHLLFTGSTAIGKHVMRAAAENLTPVTLELGGKSPAIIADDIPMIDIMDRLCFAKSLNAGQTCVAPDYVFVPRAKMSEFMQRYKHTFNQMYPTLNDNPHYTSIINQHTYERLQEWLKDAENKGAKVESVSDEIISDGSFRMPLHLVTQVSDEMTIMQHELFGPILPVIPYDQLDDALRYINERPRPLSLYLFTYNLAIQQQVTHTTHAGSMCINDALIQLGVDDLPFGGIGASGMGQYHGHEGFLNMSNAKAIMSKGKLNSMKFIYPPYGGLIQKWLTKLFTK
jgi:coniferyl-aldehyde dehydrogenase